MPTNPPAVLLLVAAALSTVHPARAEGTARAKAQWPRDGADGPAPPAPAPGSFPTGEEKHKKETFFVLWI